MEKYGDHKVQRVGFRDNASATPSSPWIPLRYCPSYLWTTIVKPDLNSSLFFFLVSGEGGVFRLTMISIPYGGRFQIGYENLSHAAAYYLGQEVGPSGSYKEKERKKEPLTNETKEVSPHFQLATQ